MINILLSVRRPFSGKILSGEKTWELRKNALCIPPENHDGVTLWLYESGKDGERAIIGKCQLWCFIPLRHMPNELMSRTLTGAWIETDQLMIAVLFVRSHPHGCVD